MSSRRSVPNFGSTFLSQARRTPCMHLVAVADLTPQRGATS